MWGRLVPVEAKAILAKIGACQARPEVIIEANRSVVVKKLSEIGPGGRLYQCQGLKCREVRVTWETKMSVGD